MYFKKIIILFSCVRVTVRLEFAKLYLFKTEKKKKKRKNNNIIYKHTTRTV